MDDQTGVSEIVFTIYPDPSTSEGSNFSSQFVIKPDYYPSIIQHLMDQISNASSPIEVEHAIDNLTQHVSKQKKELISLFESSKLRESINQRKLFVLVNEDNEPLINEKNRGLVYIAGPVGGGLPRLNHDLLEEKPSKTRYLVTFDNKDVAIPLQSVTAIADSFETNRERIIISDTNDTFDAYINKPIILDNEEYRLITAAQYFERRYHEISSTLDFSPLLDSGMTAAAALIRANNIYFEDFPSILKDRLHQYNKHNLDEFDFLGIQKIVKSDPKTTIKIAGYRFIDDGKEFNCALDELLKGLKVFLLSDNSILTIKKEIDNLRKNNDLMYAIDEYQSKLDRSKRPNIFEGRHSSNLREIIGPTAIQKNLQFSNIKPIRVPVGFFQFRKGTKLRLETSFSPEELPHEYYPIIENFGNALKFIQNGPLRILKYFPSESSVYLTFGKFMFEVCREQPDLNSDELMTIYYVAENDRQIREMFEMRGKEIEPWMEYFFAPGLSLNYHMIYTRYEQYKEPQSSAINQADTVRVVQSKKPVSIFAEKLLRDLMVPVQLKRVLAEINDWEEGILRSMNAGDISIMDGYNDSEVDQISEDWIDKVTTEKYRSGERDKQLQERLEKLEHELDVFNPGFGSFLLRLLQRERSDEVGTTESLYNTVRNIYHDLKVALIDFGLSPVEWVHAMDLQIWTTYQSQLAYMRHSLIMILSELLGLDYTGDDLDLLTNYSKINQANYSSFDGMIQGDRYVLYKKAYKYFGERLDKFKTDLEGITSLMELISKLEAAEMVARERSRANLPGLPTLRT